MSDSDSIDLSARDLMPDWVTELEKPPSPSRQEKPANRPTKARPERKPERSNRDRYERGGENRQGGGGRRPQSGRAGDRNRDNRRGRPNRSGEDRRPHRDRDQHRPQEDPLPGIDVSVEPTGSAVEALARHIRQTGRAYPMADVARMVLAARDRYQLRFLKKKPGDSSSAGAEPEGFFRCRSDGSLWLSRDEAVSHVLRSPLLNEFYTVEEIDTGPPKGNFNVIAVCGMSGQILGPPNHHEYQQTITRLHRERFSGLSFERYKSRIEMHRDEETIEKWKEKVSKKRIYRVGAAPVPQSDGTDEPAKSGGKEPESESEPAESIDQPADALETGQQPEPEPENDLETGDEPADQGAVGEATPVSEGETEPEAEQVAATPSGSVTISEDETEPEANAAPEEVSDAEVSPENGEAGDGEAEEPTELETAPSPASASETEVLESREALERHFRENHAEKSIKMVKQATVPGDIPGRDLSRSLLAKLKQETDQLRRGFPLPMIQQLCRKFEKSGLKFFKQGKKTLYVSVARPRPIQNEEALTDRIRKIVGFVRDHPRARVVTLLDALVPDYQPPPGGESFEEHHLTQAEHGVLADVRWLTMEGYLIEFPNSELLLGRQEPSSEARPKAKRKRGANGRSTKPGKTAKKDTATDATEAGADAGESAAQESSEDSPSPAEAESESESKSIDPAPDEPEAAPEPQETSGTT